MNHLAPLGPVYQAGTLSGNPLAMAAGIATLEHLIANESVIYPQLEKTTAEIAKGVAFSGCELDGEVVGAMGIQPVRNVDLVRHAYVSPARQGSGIGRALMEHLRRGASRQVLVGTWAAATWAIRFYEHSGFGLVDDEAKTLLLKTYWTITDRQIETSVVLAAPTLTFEEARRLAG